MVSSTRIRVRPVVAIGVPCGSRRSPVGLVRPGTPVFDATGLQPNRSYSSLLPFEHVDLANGAVVLTFTDLVLPGNAGRELRFQRTYNSKGDRIWTFGISGLVMSVSDTWPWEGDAPAAGLLDVAPTLTTADGGEHRAALWLNPANQGTETYRMAGTDTFWRYDRKTRTLWMPDGTVSQFDPEGRLKSNVDAFCNEDDPCNKVTLEWQTGQVMVTQTVGEMSRNVVLTLTSLPNPSLPAMPASMTFEGRTWDYQGVPLAAVVPPVGPGWTYAYEDLDAFTVTTPHGGTVRYDYEEKAFPQSDGSNTYTTVLATRTVDDGSGPAVWTYNYVLPGAGPAKKSEIVAPASIGGRTTVEYDWFNDGGFAGLKYPGRTYLACSHRSADRCGQLSPTPGLLTSVAAQSPQLPAPPRQRKAQSSPKSAAWST